MTSISDGESGSSVRTKLNASLAITDAFSVSSGSLTVAVNSASAAMTITQTGTGNSFVVEDSTTPDSNPFVVDASGNVGIGASSPVSKLDVFDSTGAIATRTLIRARDNAQSGSDVTAETKAVQFLGATNTEIGYLSFQHNQGFGARGAVNLAAIGTERPVRFFTDGNERMRISPTGNVGVGTISPNAASIVDAQSTTKGVRFPNMTTTQKNAIANAAGNVVFDTTLGKLCVNSGSGWQTITSV